jgi:hypothetical protein
MKSQSIDDEIPMELWKYAGERMKRLLLSFLLWKQGDDYY